MPTSDEDLQKLQKDVDSLRVKIEDERAKKAQAERELANDVTAAHLVAEKTRLEAELAVLKTENKKTNLTDGVAAPIAAATEDQKRAEAQLEAAQATPAKADTGSDK